MEVLMGKSTINGPFSMAMLNNKRVFFLGVTKSTFQPDLVGLMRLSRRDFGPFSDIDQIGGLIGS